MNQSIQGSSVSWLVVMIKYFISSHGDQANTDLFCTTSLTPHAAQTVGSQTPDPETWDKLANDGHVLPSLSCLLASCGCTYGKFLNDAAHLFPEYRPGALYNQCIYVCFQRVEEQCPSMPHACTCSQDSKGPPGPSGPPVRSHIHSLHHLFLDLITCPDSCGRSSLITIFFLGLFLSFVCLCLFTDLLGLFIDASVLLAAFVSLPCLFYILLFTI